MMRRLRTMRQKLVAVVMLTTFAALAVSILVIIAYDLRSFHRSLVNDLSTQSELLGHMTSAALTFDDVRLANENLALLRLRPSVRSGAIYNAGGTLFASYAGPGQAQPLATLPSGEGTRVDGDALVSVQRIVEKGEFIGTVYLRADYALVARALDYLGIAAGVTLLAMLVAYALIRRLDRIITAPVLAIAGTAREVVANRDYSRRAPRTSSDEAAELVDSFNAMLTEIEQRTGALESSYADLAREAEERTRAQHEVMRLNEELEVRVHDRTLQLETAMLEASKANQAKSAFLSSMSHELRTPLNAILGFAQILTSDSLPSTLAQKKEFASHILKSGRHLLTLINEILDLAKVESGTVALSIEPVALSDVLAECKNMIAPLAEQRNVRVLYPDRCTDVVKADRTRLKQTLLNLLSNAVKYNREQGAVVLDCSDSDQGRLRISVQDTGLGLSPEQIEALFQPFNRLGQEAGSIEGTGIGLVVTKRLVELMGGAIGVSSTAGVGSVFWIELQRTEPVGSVVETGAVHRLRPLSFASGEQFTILYVEDNPANLKLVEEIVGFRSDLRLLAAPDGHLGIELAKAHLPAMILMDLNLPCVSGMDALKALRADPRTAHIPIVALTANAMPKDIERGLEAGFFRYLTKPINIDEFTDAVNATLALVESQRKARRASES